jgi:hypothetical protein
MRGEGAGGWVDISAADLAHAPIVDGWQGPWFYGPQNKLLCSPVPVTSVPHQPDVPQRYTATQQESKLRGGKSVVGASAQQTTRGCGRSPRGTSRSHGGAQRPAGVAGRELGGQGVPACPSAGDPVGPPAGSGASMQPSRTPGAKFPRSDGSGRQAVATWLRCRGPLAQGPCQHSGWLPPAACTPGEGCSQCPSTPHQLTGATR